jgi:hypothetical protein
MRTEQGRPLAGGGSATFWLERLAKSGLSILCHLATLLHRKKISGGLAGPIPLSRSGGESEAYTIDSVTHKPISASLNSKEEIGWKVLLQNSNLW